MTQQIAIYEWPCSFDLIELLLLLLWRLLSIIMKPKNMKAWSSRHSVVQWLTTYHAVQRKTFAFSIWSLIVIIFIMLLNHIKIVQQSCTIIAVITSNTIIISSTWLANALFLNYWSDLWFQQLKCVRNIFLSIIILSWCLSLLLISSMLSFPFDTLIRCSNITEFRMDTYTTALKTDTHTCSWIFE